MQQMTFSLHYGNIPEVATGRYPARNEQEVIDFVNKVVSIDNETEFGPWRQKVTLIADDAARPEPKHGSINTGNLIRLIQNNYQRLFHLLFKLKKYI